jgi:hypothetical protein
MGAASSTKKKAKALSPEDVETLKADLSEASVEDVTTFEEDDDPLALAGDFVEDDSEETK